MPLKYPLSLGALCVLVGLQAYAEEQTALDTITVDGNATEVKANQIKKTRKVIQEELIADNYDLVRYATDVGISDNGRRNKGFAMRGVEGNRVGISIDGVNLPDSEENSLYARYGNFNSSRLSIDPELVQGIDIMRGADSFNAGSGSLGGSVNYRTLGADDIILPGKKWGVLLKNGYASKNREWTHTVGTAYKGDKFDATLLYSYRNGHEMKSRGNGEDISGNARGIPDPSHHKNHSYLAKMGYFITPSHRVSASFNGQSADNFIDEKSYTLNLSSWRESKDIGKRYNANLAYEYFPENNRWLSYLRTDLDWQKTDIGSKNYKGGRRYNSDLTKLLPQKHLYEIQDTHMNTRFMRASLRAELMPWESPWGSHQFTLRSGISQKDFDNRNNHEYPNDKDSSAKDSESIQHPVRTRSFFAQLQDSVTWNDMFSSQLGVRYDWDELVPQDLKATCRACSRKPASNTFQSLSGSLGLDAQLNDIWKVGYNVSSGFRIPTASEMYFSYEHPAGNWIPNPDLKAEQALNQSIHIQAAHQLGLFGLNVYHTRYKNFLTEQESTYKKWNKFYNSHSASYGQQPYYTTIAQQAVNIDRARISGLEFNSKVNLDQVISTIPQGWKFLANLGYAKGKLSGTEASLLSIQPIKVILGVGYEDPNDRWGINAKASYLGAKKAKDAQVVQYTSNFVREVKTYPYLNGSAVLFDLYGFYKVNRHVTLRAGVYNILNRKYHTWDTLRGINKVSTTDSVDKDRKGLERFYAPGRNVAGSIEIRF
jgi:tonB-dependent hemoglobin/transferrin/lactoferrin receptor family protein